MGVAHGAFCVGCCWSLMLVMFGVGLGSLTAMLALGGLTAIEKNLPWGRRLTPAARRRPRPGRGLRDRRVRPCVVCSTRGGRRRRHDAQTRAERREQATADTRARSSPPPARACSPTATRTSRRGASPRRPASRSARSTTTSAASSSSSSRCSRRRTRGSSSASAQMYGGAEPLWQQWERACDFLDEDLASGLRPGPPGDDRRRLVRRRRSRPRSASYLGGWYTLLAEVAEREAHRLGGLGPFTPGGGRRR